MSVIVYFTDLGSPVIYLTASTRRFRRKTKTAVFCMNFQKQLAQMCILLNR